MLKSNCKAVKTAIRGYIVDYLRNGTDFEGADDFDLVCNYCRATLRNLRGINYPVSDFEKIRYDLDCGGWECGTYARRMMLKDWLQETDDECMRFDDNKVDEMWKSLVAREVLSMAR